MLLSPPSGQGTAGTFAPAAAPTLHPHSAALPVAPSHSSLRAWGAAGGSASPRCQAGPLSLLGTVVGGPVQSVAPQTQHRCDGRPSGLATVLATPPQSGDRPQPLSARCAVPCACTSQPTAPPCTSHPSPQILPYPTPRLPQPLGVPPAPLQTLPPAQIPPFASPVLPAPSEPPPLFAVAMTPLPAPPLPSKPRPPSPLGPAPLPVPEVPPVPRDGQSRRRRRLQQTRPFKKRDETAAGTRAALPQAGAAPSAAAGPAVRGAAGAGAGTVPGGHKRRGATGSCATA